MDEFDARLHPSTVEAILNGGYEGDAYMIAMYGGTEHDNDWMEQYEDFPRLRGAEFISGDCETKYLFGDLTFEEFCKQYNIPEDEFNQVFNDGGFSSGSTHAIYIEKS